MIKYNPLSLMVNNWLWRRTSDLDSHAIIPKNHNKWLFKETWGDPMAAIDFSGNQTLSEDDRVHIVYKNQYPTMCKEYVLWRVEHDGSCWVSSGITQLIYQMIEAGPEKFDEVIEYLKSLFASDPEFTQTENEAVSSNLFMILELIREKMDHSFSLALRNHRNVYEALDRGFRKILSLYWRKHDDAKATEINISNSLGFAADFKGFLHEMGFKYAEFLTDGECNGVSATTSFFDLCAYLTEPEISLFSHGDENRQKNIIQKKMPKVMSFLSDPGYMDIAVQKSISDQINAKRRAYNTKTKFIELVNRFFQQVRLLKLNMNPTFENN